MWKWSCPKDPSMTWENHTLEDSQKMLDAHLKVGYPTLGIKPCVLSPKAHNIKDDGRPCTMGSCDKGYTRRLSDVK